MFIIFMYLIQIKVARIYIVFQFIINMIVNIYENYLFSKEKEFVIDEVIEYLEVKTKEQSEVLGKNQKMTNKNFMIFIVTLPLLLICIETDLLNVYLKYSTLFFVLVIFRGSLHLDITFKEIVLYTLCNLILFCFVVGFHLKMFIVILLITSIDQVILIRKVKV